MQVITGTDANHQVILAPLKQVIPNGADNSVQLAVSFADDENAMLGIEGAILFINATSSSGSIVLDRIVDADGDVQSLPAGDYTLIAYYRPCDANCGFLDPPQEFCSVTQALDADQQYWLTVRINAHECVLALAS
jgi:hypothetical protein